MAVVREAKAGAEKGEGGGGEEESVVEECAALREAVAAAQSVGAAGLG